MLTYLRGQPDFESRFFVGCFSLPVGSCSASSTLHSILHEKLHSFDFLAWQSSGHCWAVHCSFCLQIAAWRPAVDSAASDDDDPSEAFERIDLECKAAATGDPSSTAYYAAKKHTNKLLGARQTAATLPAARRVV